MAARVIEVWRYLDANLYTKLARFILGFSSHGFDKKGWRNIFELLKSEGKRISVIEAG